MTYQSHNNTNSHTPQNITLTGAVYDVDMIPEEIREREDSHIDIDSVLRSGSSYDEHDLASVNGGDDYDDATLLSLYKTPQEKGASPEYLYKASSLEYHKSHTLGGQINSYLERNNGSFVARPAYVGQTDTTLTADLTYFIYAQYVLRPYTTVREALANDIIAQRLKQGADQVFVFIAHAKRELTERYIQYVAEREARREIELARIAEKKQALLATMAPTIPQPIAQQVETAYTIEAPQESPVPSMSASTMSSPVKTTDIADLLPATDEAYQRYFGAQEPVVEAVQKEVLKKQYEQPEAPIAERKTEETIHTHIVAPIISEHSADIGLITPAKPPIDFDAWAREISGGIRKLFARSASEAHRGVSEDFAPSDATHYGTYSNTHQAPHARIVNQRLVARAPEHTVSRRFPSARTHTPAPEMVAPSPQVFRNKEPQCFEDIFELTSNAMVLRSQHGHTEAVIENSHQPMAQTPRTVPRKRSRTITLLDGIARINSWAFIKVMFGVWFVATVLMGFLKTVGVLAF